MESEDKGDDSFLEDNLRQNYPLLPNEVISMKMVTSEKNNPRSWSVDDVHNFLLDKGLTNAATKLSSIGITGSELLRQDMSQLALIMGNHEAIETYRQVKELRNVDAEFKKMTSVQTSSLLLNQNLPPIPRVPKRNFQFHGQLSENRGFERPVWTEKTDPVALSRLPKDVPQLQNFTRRMEGKQCYRCNKWGHIQRYCPIPSYCSICRQYGHSTSSCQNGGDYRVKCGDNHSHVKCVPAGPGGGFSPTPSTEAWDFGVKDFTSKFMENRLQNSNLNQMEEPDSLQISNPSEDDIDIWTQESQNPKDVIQENFEDGEEVVESVREIPQTVPSQQVSMSNQLEPTEEDSNPSTIPMDPQIPLVPLADVSSMSFPTTDSMELNQDMNETPLTEPVVSSAKHGENFLELLDLSKKQEICQVNETANNKGVIEDMSTDLVEDSTGRKLDTFICCDCEKSFNTKRSLTTHVKRSHPTGIISNPTIEKPLPPRKSTLRRLGTTGPILQMDAKSTTKGTRATKTEKKTTFKIEPVITHEENGSVKISLGEKEWEWSDEDVQLQPITNHKEATKVTKKLLCHLVGHPQHEHVYWGTRTLRNGICKDTIRIVTWWVARQDGSRRTHLDPKTGQIVVETLDTCIQNLRNGISQMCNQAEISLRGANRREERRKDTSVRRKDISVRSHRHPPSVPDISPLIPKSQKVPLVRKTNLKTQNLPTNPSSPPSTSFKLSTKRRRLEIPPSPSTSMTGVTELDTNVKTPENQEKDKDYQTGEINVTDEDIINTEENSEENTEETGTNIRVHTHVTKIPQMVNLSKDEENEFSVTIQDDDEEGEVLIQKPHPLSKPNPKIGSPLSSPSTSLVQVNSKSQDDVSNRQNLNTPQPTPVEIEQMKSEVADFATMIVNAATRAAARGLNSTGVVNSVVAAALSGIANCCLASGCDTIGITDVLNSVAAAAIPSPRRVYQQNSIPTPQHSIGSGLSPDRNSVPTQLNDSKALIGSETPLHFKPKGSMSESVGEEDVPDID